MVYNLVAMDKSQFIEDFPNTSIYEGFTMICYKVRLPELLPHKPNSSILT